MTKLKVYEDAAGNWRFRLVGGNGEKVAGSEAYASKANAVRAAEWVKANASSAQIEEA